MALHPIPLPCALALPPSSHRDATTPSLCWAPHFMFQEHLEFSNPTRAGRASLPPNDERRYAFGSHSTLAPRLYLAAYNPVSSCRFWVLDHLCSNLTESFHSCWITETQYLNLCVCFIFEPVCVFYLFLFCLCFLIENNFSFKSLFAIWSLSPWCFHCHF